MKLKIFLKYMMSYILVCLLWSSVLSGCSDIGNDSSKAADDSKSKIAENVRKEREIPEIPNAVHMYVKAATNPSPEDWEDAKKRIASRLEILADDLAYYIEDMGDALYILADKSMFEGEIIEDVMKDFIIMPLRFGLYKPDEGEIRYFEPGELAEVNRVSDDNSKETEIEIGLASDNDSQLNEWLEFENIQFAFSIGTTCWATDISYDKKENVIHLDSQEMKERFRALIYYDLTTEFPKVRSMLYIYPQVTWIEPAHVSDSGQQSRSDLMGPVTEIVYGFTENPQVSENVFEKTLNILQERLEVFGCKFALGMSYEDKKVVVALEEPCPDKYPLLLLGGNQDVSLRVGYEETDFTGSETLNSVDSGEACNFSVDELTGKPLLEFSQYGNELLYDVTADAVEKDRAISVLVDGYPLGYIRPEKRIGDGKLLVDVPLIDGDINECVSFLSGIFGKARMPMPLILENTYMCEGESLRKPVKTGTAYENTENHIFESLTGAVPRLFRVEAKDKLVFYLRVDQTENLVQEYKRDINTILEAYPYPECSFREMGFYLCDEDDTYLYRVYINTIGDFSTVPFSKKVWIYSFNSGIEEMDSYKDELSHITDEGAIHYE